jgi:hypothetical protein
MRPGAIMSAIDMAVSGLEMKPSLRLHDTSGTKASQKAPLIACRHRSLRYRRFYGGLGGPQ